MEEEITSPKKARLDSNRVDHPIFGSPMKKLPSNRFPSFLQILNHVRFLKSQHLMSKQDIYNTVADDLIKTWESAFVVPILNKKTVSDKLKKEVEKKINHVSQKLSKILENKNDFVSEMSKVFSITKCTCFVEKETKEEIIPSNCVYDIKNKIINLDCYGHQMFRTLEIFVSEEDKLTFSKMVETLENQTPKKQSPPPASSSSTSPADNIYQKKYLPTHERPRPINYNMSLEEEVPEIAKETQINWDPVIETCIAQGNKPYQIMKIINSMIVTLQLPPHLIWSESTLRRRIHDLYARNSERHGELFTELKVIGFDERQDKTLQKNGKIEPEKHITFTNECDYVDQATIEGKNTAENVCEKLWEVTMKTFSEQSTDFLMADTCHTNFGPEGKKYSFKHSIMSCVFFSIFLTT